MKKRKSLERAVILGLLLSTSVYGSAWAADVGSIELNGTSPNSQSFGDKEIVAIQKVAEPTFGIYLNTDNSGQFITEKELKFNSLKINLTNESKDSYFRHPYLAGIMTDGEDNIAVLNIDSDNGIDIATTSKNNYAVVGVWSQSEDTININGKYVNITAIKEAVYTNNSYIADTSLEDRTLRAVYGINASKNPPNDAVNGSTINITASDGNIYIKAENKSTIKDVDDRENANTYAAANDHGNIILKAKNNNIILSAETNEGNAYGLDTWGGKENDFDAKTINIKALNHGEGDAFGIKVKNGGRKNEFYATEFNKITAQANSGNAYGVFVEDGSSINIASDGKNYISANVTGEKESKTGIGIGIKASNSTEENYTVVYVSGEQNYINANETGFTVNKNLTAITAEDKAMVLIQADGNDDQLLNKIGGAVYAKDLGSSVTIFGKGDNGEESVNNIYSASVIYQAGDLQNDDAFKDKEVISALYAEDGGHISVSGKQNIIGTSADNTNENELERVIWAYNGANINIDGMTVIKTDRYTTSPNSLDVAIAAGSATGLDAETIGKPVDDRATVTLKYDNYNDGEKTYQSYINGDILAAYAGRVDIYSDNDAAGINIEGNLLAGNNGILNVDLGNGGILTGRADDYGDAGVLTNADGDNDHQTFYNPAFSSEIFKGGRVDLTMGAGSKWFVTGQSWVTNIDTTAANVDTSDTRATIYLKNAYVDNKTAHALTVYNFNGDADFVMNLSGNRANSDMLYMKTAKGNYRILLADVVTTEEINNDSGLDFNGLRFATVGNAGSDVTFTVGSYDNGGAFNVEYVVGTDAYGSVETAGENEHYNGTELNGGKPGDDMVDNFFSSTGTPVDDETTSDEASGISTMSLKAENGIMLMDETGEAETADENTYNATNYKLITQGEHYLSDTGETILNMSRANYSNAIYMDRLNKRLGEARYINGEEDQGMWVRIRHDRIGKTDAYRSQNTMYELGYDEKQECDNGMRRVGFAIDYMHGDTGYNDIAGKGEIDRYGLWLYDTWMGDKGHYVDYVAKWGHLSNDFEVYTMRDGDKVTGDYSNNVFSISAEYGRKKDIGNDWYFEPQAQLQLARVTGADYTTNQDTKVSVDGINSLIGRAGFRLGKDFGEEKQSTVYIKADVLHEFLGDQDVYVYDSSSDNKWAGISYENEGTWYDVGIGFAAMMSKNSYAFLDLEKSFGHDNDETYQINAGMQWTF